MVFEISHHKIYFIGMKNICFSVARRDNPESFWLYLLSGAKINKCEIISIYDGIVYDNCYKKLTI